MKKSPVFASLAFSLTLMFASACLASAQSADAQQTLNQYISDLQKNPNDNALREKIIKFVQEMKPPPAIPEEAERYMARGAAAAKGAKNPNDFKDAVREFEKATLVAPWLANAYYNLGIAQDGAGMYTEAIKSLKLYLLAVPNASDAKKLIYEIEYRQEKAAKESSPEAVAAKKEKEQEDFLKKINGARYIWNSSQGGIEGYNTLDVQGDTITLGCVTTKSWDPKDKIGVWEKLAWTFKIEGRTLRAFMHGRTDPSVTGVIADDGSTMTIYRTYTNSKRVEVYKREQ